MIAHMVDIIVLLDCTSLEIHIKLSADIGQLRIKDPTVLYSGADISRFGQVYLVLHICLFLPNGKFNVYR